MTYTGLFAGIAGALHKINEEVSGLDRASLKLELVRVAQINVPRGDGSLDDQKRELGARLSMFHLDDGYESFTFFVPPDSFKALNIASTELTELQEALGRLSGKFNKAVVLEAIEFDPEFTTATAVISVADCVPAPAVA